MWWRGARPRTLGAGVVAGGGRHRRGRRGDLVAVRRRDRRRGRAADRRELRERLLRRRVGGRHRRTAGPAAAHAERGGDPALRCSSPRWVALGVAAGRGARARARDVAGADPGRRCARARRGAPVQRRPATVRGARARRADGVRVLRARRDVRHDVRDGRDGAGGVVVVRRGRWGCSPSRSWWRTTCATSRPTRRAASGRSPSGSATRGRAGSTARASSARSS